MLDFCPKPFRNQNTQGTVSTGSVGFVVGQQAGGQVSWQIGWLWQSFDKKKTKKGLKKPNRPDEKQKMKKCRWIQQNMLTFCSTVYIVVVIIEDAQWKC